MRKPERWANTSLLRMLARQRRSSLFVAALMTSLCLLGAGCVMILSPFVGQEGAPSTQDLSVAMFGCAAIAVGVLLFVNTTLCQLAHEILLRLDDDCNRNCRTDTDSEREGAIGSSRKVE